jgi:hypothetical protein
VAGLAVLLLPFLVLAPGQLVNDVIVTQYIRSAVGHASPVPRLANLAGLSLFPGLSGGLRVGLLLAIAAIAGVGYLAACRAGARRPAALDWYALISVVAVIAMLLWPDKYWSHYGAFAAPFIALVFALPAGLLRPAEYSYQIVPLIAVSVVVAVVIVAVGARQFAADTRQRTWSTISADKLIPPGSCVVTNEVPYTISANRFTAGAPGCPALVDSSGSLLALTHGHGMKLATPQELRAVTALWRSAFTQARYVWIESGSQVQIPWTPALYAYFTSHFKLIGLVDGPGARNTPEGGLYVRR